METSSSKEPAQFMNFLDRHKLVAAGLSLMLLATGIRTTDEALPVDFEVATYMQDSEPVAETFVCSARREIVDTPDYEEIMQVADDANVPKPPRLSFRELDLSVQVGPRIEESWYIKEFQNDTYPKLQVERISDVNTINAMNKLKAQVDLVPDSFSKLNLSSERTTATSVNLVGDIQATDSKGKQTEAKYFVAKDGSILLSEKHIESFPSAYMKSVLQNKMKDKCLYDFIKSKYPLYNDEQLLDAVSHDLANLIIGHDWGIGVRYPVLSITHTGYPMIRSAFDGDDAVEQQKKFSEHVREVVNKAFRSDTENRFALDVANLIGHKQGQDLYAAAYDRKEKIIQDAIASFDDRIDELELAKNYNVLGLQQFDAENIEKLLDYGNLIRYREAVTEMNFIEIDAYPSLASIFTPVLVVPTIDGTFVQLVVDKNSHTLVARLDSDARDAAEKDPMFRDYLVQRLQTVLQTNAPKLYNDVDPHKGIEIKTLPNSVGVDMYNVVVNLKNGVKL